MIWDHPLLDQFIRYLKAERGASPRTIATYAYVIRGYLRFLAEKGMAPADANSRTISDYLAAKADCGLKGSSIHTAGMAIRSFCKFLVSRGLAAADATNGITLPTTKARLPDPLSEEEVAKLLSSPAVRFPPIRDIAIAELLYGSGLRISEALAVEASDIHFQEGYVRVRSGKGGRERLVPLGKRAAAAIQHYLEERNRRFGEQPGPIFLTSRGAPLSRTAYWDRLRKLAISAGIKKPLFPHLLRHCFGSHMVQRGADLRSTQEMMGHKSWSSTHIYVHVDPRRLTSLYKSTHPRA